jgi:AcrR family transcriptional regulator
VTGEHERNAVDGQPAATASRRGRPRDAAADERIRKAAADLLLQRGFGRMTIDEVAELAGVAKATVYRRYPSKEDLAADAMQRLFDVEIPVPDTGSLRSDLEQLYTNALAFSRSEQGEAFLRLAAAECCRDVRVAGLYREMLLTRVKLVQPVVDRAVERGEMRAGVDVPTLFDWLPGLVILRVLSGRPLPELTEVADLVEWTLHGVAPTGRPGGSRRRVRRGRPDRPGE